MVDKLRNQDGVISLLTATIISLLFMVLTLAMVKLMSSELRAASDTQNSITALYAADSAAEDRILSIKNAIASGSAANLAALNTFCGSAAVPYGLINGNVTCTSFNPSGSSDISDGEINQDESMVYFVPTNVSSFRIDWEEQDGTAITPLQANPPQSYSGTAWSGPAPLNISIISYTPATAATTASFRRVDVYGTDPSGPSSPNINVGAIPAGTATLANVVKNQCGSSSYRCNITLQTFKSNTEKAVIRISPRYKGIKLRIKTNNKVFGQTASLDITAQVGASFRRVVQRVNLNAGPFSAVGDVIRGDEEVCKVIQQLQAPGYNEVNPTTGCLGGGGSGFN